MVKFVNILYYTAYLAISIINKKLFSNPIRTLYNTDLVNNKLKNKGVKIKKVHRQLDDILYGYGFSYSMYYAFGAMILTSTMLLIFIVNVISIFMYSGSFSLFDLPAFEVIPLMAIFNFILYYPTILRNDKHLDYFKTFEKESSKTKLQYLLITLTTYVILITLVLYSFKYIEIK